MVDKHSDDITQDEDFEWVNSWASGTGGTKREPAPVAEEPGDTLVAEPVVRSEPTPSPAFVPAAEPMATRAPDFLSSTPPVISAATLAPPIFQAAPEATSAPALAPDLKFEPAEAPAFVPANPEIVAPAAPSVTPAPMPAPEVDAPAAKRSLGRLIGLTAMGGRASGPFRDRLSRILAGKRKVEPEAAASFFPVDGTQPELVPANDPAAPGEFASPPSAPSAAALVPAAAALTAEEQLARDIAEIESVRDALYAMPAIVMPRVRRPRRTSDSVPILVGSVVAIALLVVFGIAASLVTLAR